ncbi:methyltransferase [Kribbella sp. NPDC050281]|uniref:methyltransferase n=1 Tax=Kribbella sp. NPDC050281 TaxID=3155515 RepID=UPI0034093FF8
MPQSTSAPGPDQVTDLVTPVVVRVAVTIGLLSAICAEPTPLSQLAIGLGIDESVLRRLVRFLAVRGILAVDANGVVASTELGRRIADRTGPYAARLDWSGAAGQMDRSFVEDCLAALQGRRRRPDPWAVFDDDPVLSGSFDTLMSARAAEWADELVDDPLWGRLGCVADLGGGRGHLLYRLLRAWPHLNGALVERPGPARAAQEEAERLGLTDRTQVVTADLRDPLPTGYDAYVLAHVLHDWNDDGAAVILRRAAEACGPDGRVVVVERELTDDQAGSAAGLDATAQDLRLFVLFGGGERTHDDLHALAVSVGLSLERRRRLTSGRSLLVFARPPLEDPSPSRR